MQNHQYQQVLWGMGKIEASIEQAKYVHSTTG